MALPRSALLAVLLVIVLCSDVNAIDCGDGIKCYPCSEPSVGVCTFDCSNTSNIHKGVCIHDHKGIVKSLHVSTPEECCAACASEQECDGWTAWDASTGSLTEPSTQLSCNLFKGTGTAVPGPTCVSGSPAPPPTPAPPGPPCKDCPNILLMFTDDQDLLIGGWTPMSKTKLRVQDKGAAFTNWRIHTPICAPSRSELMSGRYFHNIKNDVYTPNNALCGSGAVGHVDLNHKVYPNMFANKLRVEKGYATGLFGKCMNGGCNNPASMAGAFDRWFEGTSYQDGSYFDNESPGNKFNAKGYHSGYGTSVIGNKTIEWLHTVAGKQPFFVYFAPHAPHSPATPSAWYKDACVNVTSPRNPAFNWSTPLFHNLVSRQPVLNDQDALQIDTLARKRCQTLLSVDDSYSEILDTLEELGVVNNTYVLVSSDHGYNLGQHRLPSNKFLLYEHSLRIPMLVRGPGIKAGTKLDFYGTNVDLAPTMLGMAGIERPEGMDGRSVLPLLIPDPDDTVPAPTRQHVKSTPVPKRTSSFHEYYNQGPWEIDTRHPLDDWSNTYIGITLTTGDGHHYKYAEYDPTGSQSNFTNVDVYELFDLDADPYELHNIYNQSNQKLRTLLHTTVRQWYECTGASCL